MPIVHPTYLTPLPHLMACAQRLGLEQYLSRPKHGCSTLILAIAWLVLAWRGSGRPYQVRYLADPLHAALLGREQLPSAKTFARSLAYYAVKDVCATADGRLPPDREGQAGRGMVVAETPPPLMGAFKRLLDLLDSPQAISSFLSGSRQLARTSPSPSRRGSRTQPAQ
jgi:hypothetical protein